MRFPHRSRPALLPFVLLGAGAFGLMSTGCVKRTIRITSDPSGALVWLNDREIGRTPVDVEFVHYGTYDVRLIKDAYEPLLTFGQATPPIWDNVGPDFIAEVLPFEFQSRVEWHYTLEPTTEDTERLRFELLERARGLRHDEGSAENAAGDG